LNAIRKTATASTDRRRRRRITERHEYLHGITQIPDPDYKVDIAEEEPPAPEEWVMEVSSKTRVEKRLDQMNAKADRAVDRVESKLKRVERLLET